MGLPKPDQPKLEPIDQVAGYLNFSSGNHDPGFYRAINTLFLQFPPQPSSDPGEPDNRLSGTAADSVLTSLSSHLDKLQQRGGTWRDTFQSRFVIEMTRWLIPVFLDRHRDLLFHQSAHTLLTPFFLARIFETILSESDSIPSNYSWIDPDRIAQSLVPRETNGAADVNQQQINQLVQRLLSRINDYVGHRPVASLESGKMDPYAREWVPAIPVYLPDAGIAAGPYHDLISRAIEILRDTDPHVLRAASFDPDRLKELAIDPRAYDFDHPVNKRPNHHFGGWDERRISSDNFFERFIVHRVILDSLLQRVDDESQPATGANDPHKTNSRTELMEEASAVLAGTILMASGITGEGPSAHDSNTTLGTLLPVIGGYRDDFYRDRIAKTGPEHRERLLAESKSRHQPFGAVRQDLNSRLARRRASQLVNCRLASIFARMGYPDAAEKQSAIVPVVSARMLTRIDCLLSSANQSLDRLSHSRLTTIVTAADPDAARRPDAGREEEDILQEAAANIPRLFARLQDGIQCGAIVDPWNILGFDAHYSLFPALENSVVDHRAHELVDVVERIFALCSRLWSEAAAHNRPKICERVKYHFGEIADWWRKYAAHEVMAVEAVDPREIFSAAELVARALQLWQEGGAETGDIRFWAGHAGMFDSPKAYALVIDALMQRGDYATSSALLIHWLGEAAYVGLAHGDSSFHELVFRWINEQKNLLAWTLASEARHDNRNIDEPAGQTSDDDPDAESADRVIDNTWNRIRKFHDFIEANAEQYWRVPTFQPGRTEEEIRELTEEAIQDQEDEPDEEENKFDNAYVDMVYEDTTDDGVDGAIYENNQSSDDTLENEVERILERLEFTATLAGFWQVAATIPLPESIKSNPDENICERLKKRREIVSAWIAQAVSNRNRIIDLLESANNYRIPKAGIDRDSMMEYDRHRLFKETLLDRAINTCVETENAIRRLSCVVRAIDCVVDQRPINQADEDGTLKSLVGGHNELITVFAADLLDRAADVSEHLPALIEFFHNQPLLYVPFSKGGDPEAIVRARVIQTAMLDLLGSLPSLGLLSETFDLTRAALTMERANPVTSGAVTEFDELFQVAFTSMVQSLIDSTGTLAGKLEKELAAGGNAGTLEKSTAESGVANDSVDASESADASDPVDASESVIAFKTTSEIMAHCETVLFECVEMLTESMLILWLDHSRTLRLSVLEKVIDESSWKALVEFIEKYGDSLFTQEFFQHANIRTILHQGTDHWLEQLIRSPSCPDLRLIDELGTGIPRDRAVRFITLVLESVLENYAEFCDYNSTTTQSDHGNLVHVLLDFLRLRARYERVSWNLKPVVWAHEVLVRDGENGVARLWRRSLRERVGPEADKYLQRLEKLRSTYSIRLESIGRRLEEKFGHPMQIDRLRALVGPAMQDPRESSSQRSFELLYQETKAFSRATMGVGMDLPGWLAALENEVHHAMMFVGIQAKFQEVDEPVFKPVPIADLRKQLEQLPRRERKPDSGK